MRMTQKHVEAKVDYVNGMLGFTDYVKYSTVGALYLNGAYGGYAVYRWVNDAGGVSDLTGGHGTLREAAKFLDGMMTALRIAQDTTPKGA